MRWEEGRARDRNGFQSIRENAEERIGGGWEKREILGNPGSRQKAPGETPRQGTRRGAAHAREKFEDFVMAYEPKG